MRAVNDGATGDRGYLAIDLGASSGRALLVSFDGRRVRWEEAHRFGNGPTARDGGLFWDAPGLLREIQRGLSACAARGVRLRSAGIDTWGVDFGLLGEDGALLSAPRHYRDPRNEPAMEVALRRIPRARIYETTGIQFMPLNTLYQLCAARADGALRAARRLLFMPDLFNYWLTGEAVTERTIASTSQMLDARRGAWDEALLAALDLPAQILPPMRPTGSVCGTLTPQVSAQVGHAGMPVVLTAGHDTASAIAAVPAAGDDWAYISSGTWSLVGVELDAPVIGAASLAANFTNEAGVAGTTRFLKNVAGLWLLQECRRCWNEAGAAWTFGELDAQAEAAPPLRSLIDPDDARYATPGDMPARIAAACRERGEPAPESPGGMTRCILESLALRYDEVLRTAAALTGRTISTVHVVGGGAQNDLLNRMIAAATGKMVVAGPVEATALGNALVQALALGDLPGIPAARNVVRASVTLRRYDPPSGSAERERWDAARRRFAGLTGSGA